MSVIFLSLLFLSFAFPCTKAEFEVNETKISRFLVDAVIRQLFELVKEVIKNGNDEHGIPVLDPYKFDHTSLQLNGGLSGAVNITNGILTGLGDHQIRSFTFTKSDISIELELHFRQISILAEHYEMDGTLVEFIPIIGKGMLSIAVENATIQGKIFLKQSDDGKSILLKHFHDMRFTIQNIKSDTQFDGNMDNIFNAMIHDLLPDYLSKFSKFICDLYGDRVVRTLNVVLDKLENWYIIATIL